MLSSTINPLIAEYLSALAYAPLSATQDAIQWGLKSNKFTDPVYDAAFSVDRSGWQDNTQRLVDQFNSVNRSHINFYDAIGAISSDSPVPLNEFRVFVNDQSHQIVFAFKGSSLNPNNWLSDIGTNDQGATQYAAIEAKAQALYSWMAANPDYASYQFFADGHSLGGGMAQTFALQNNISGFGQNALPIAQGSQNAPQYWTNAPGGTFATAKTAYEQSGNSAKFYELNLQGDIASSAYHSIITGGQYLDSNLTQWVYNPTADTEKALAYSEPYMPLGTQAAYTGVVAVNAGISHMLATMIPLTEKQFDAPGGFVSATPDSSADQAAVGALLSPLLNAISSIGMKVNPDESFTIPGLGTFNQVAGSDSRDPLKAVGANSPSLIGGSTPVAAGSTNQLSTLKQISGSGVLIGTGAPTVMMGGAGATTMVGGTGNTTMYGGSGTNLYDFEDVDSAPNTTEVIVQPKANDSVMVNNTFVTGTQAVGTDYKWTDSSGNQYSFVVNGAEGQSSIGNLTITKGLLGASTGNQITINNFNLSQAQQPGGFMGIVLGPSLSQTAKANIGVDPPAPDFLEGGNESFTLWIDAPTTSPQVITESLNGASPSDFQVTIGDTVENINPDGTFTLTLPAGQTSIAFTLTDITSDTGSTDISAGASLTLTASMPDYANPSSAPLTTSVLTFSYVPTPWNTAGENTPQGLAPQSNDGTTATYVGDGADDLVSAAAPNDTINLTNSGNDSILGGSATNYIQTSDGNSIIVGNGSASRILTGDGNNEIFVGSQVALPTAMANAWSSAATGVQGDFIGVLDGNNTIVAGRGNDAITAGAGDDVVVLGPGNDVYFGGWETTEIDSNWSILRSGGTTGISNINGYLEAYTNPYQQPYNGNIETDFSGIIGNVGPENATIYGSTGNYFIGLGNGSNYVEVGSGNSTVQAGMGDNTIVAGSGNELIRNGGGTSYIYGGSGQDSIYGGDGSNTVIGGSGNSTIYAGTFLDPNANFNPTVVFPGANLDSNYVSGGSGNDVIYGSGGMDTLVAGSGNTTIYGQTGNEVIIGGSGVDLLYGGVGNTTMVAGSATDSLLAAGSSSSTSYLFGGSGSDFIVGGSGANIINAGDGGVAGSATSVFASQADSTAATTLIGGAGVDLLEGGTGTSVIYGGSGGTAGAATTLVGWTGNDTMYGGLGTDIIQGGSGTEVLYAGDGGTSSAPTTVVSGGGLDTLTGGAGNAILKDLQGGSDLLTAGSGDATLIGIGNDTLVAGTGNDVLQANSGSVTVVINSDLGNVTVNGAANVSSTIDFGTGIANTNLAGTVVFDSSGDAGLLVEGIGGTVDAANGLTGGINAVTFTDSGPMTTKSLMKTVFSSDQTYSYNNANTFVNVSDGMSITTGLYHDLVSSWGDRVNIQAGQNYFGDLIYSAGDQATITSGTGADQIIAAGANDTIRGGTFSDLITVSGANDRVISASGADTITATGYADTLYGGTSNDQFIVQNSSTVIQVTSTTVSDSVISYVSYTIPVNVASLTLSGSSNIVATGGVAANTIIAGAGNDTLVAGAGLSTMIGGTGGTTFVLSNVADVVTDSYSGVVNTVTTGFSYTLGANVNVLQLTGTASLTGTANSANDTLISNTGVDTLYGGIGNDTFILNNPADTVIDTLGTATIIYQATADFTLPTNVNTLSLSGTVAIHATGNAGNDSITANAGQDTLTAGNGNDTLVSGIGKDSLAGGAGSDVFVVNNTQDVVTVPGTHGNDTVESTVSYTLPTNISTLLLLGTSNLTATGGATAATLIGNSGADTLFAGTGATTLIGGIGSDMFVVIGPNDLVQDTYVGGNNTISSSANYTLVTNVNTLVLSGTTALVGTANAANDTLVGNSAADTLVAGSANDIFIVSNSSTVVQDVYSGGIVQSGVNYSLPSGIATLLLTGTQALVGTTSAGNSVVTANSGADTLVAVGNATLISSSSSAVESLVGGAGNVLFIVNNTADHISVGGSHGADSIESGSSYTLPSNVNTLLLQGSANLTGAALSGNNSLVGNAGADSLKAGSGNDTLIAGTGVASLVGGSSADTFVINNSADVIQSASAAAGNTVISTVSYTLVSNINVLEFAGYTNVAGYGNSASDTLVANSGNDTLVAGAGQASFVGGLGADLFVVNSAADVVSDPDYAIKAAFDTLQSSVSLTLPGVVDVLVLTGTGALRAVGNGHADLLVGNSGADTLVALGGNDTLTAGVGAATLIGGTGNDVFVVNSSADVVQDSLTSYHNAVFSSVGLTLPTNVNTLTLTGSAGVRAVANAANDNITGNAGADTLVAGVGNDTLRAGSGLATMLGGSGVATFVVNNSADVIQSASASAGNTILSTASYSLPTNINILTLTGFANVSGTGNSAADTLTAGAGRDTLIAGLGLATLVGGPGNDTFVVNNSQDVVVDSSTTTSNSVQASVSFSLATNVNQLLLTGTGALKGTANSGNDTLTSNSGIDTLIGGNGNDTFVLNNANDVVQDTIAGHSNTIIAGFSVTLPANVNAIVLTGSGALKATANTGNDTLTSNSGADTLVGGSGSDTFVVNNAADLIQSASSTGNNAVLSAVSYSLPTNVALLTLVGTNFLTATGNASADTLVGNSGNDTFIAGAGLATMLGGVGSNVFLVNNSGDVVTDSNTQSSNTVQSSVSYSLAANINTLLLTGTAALVASANNGADTLVSNTGVDTLIGGSGLDVFVINNASDVIQNILAGDTIESSVSYAMQAGIQSITLIGSANISATGNANSDVLIAGVGNDTLSAGSGTATLIGGSGNDTFAINNSADVVQDTSTSSSNVIVSSVSYSLPTNVDSLTLTGSGSLTATGNFDTSNTLTANAGNDLLIANALNNTLYGGAGADTINAGAEYNLIYAGNGGTASQPTVVLGNTSNTGFYTQSTIYGGTGTDLLYGGPGSDIIYSGTGNDSLYAGGADTLVGGTGSDELDGQSTQPTVFEFNVGFGQEEVNTELVSGDSLLFGSGISPSSLHLSMSAGGYPSLDISSGSGLITATYGLQPGEISNITFADSGQETLTQLMQTAGPGTQSLSGGTYLISSNGQSFTDDGSTNLIYDFGNTDSITANANSAVLYIYGNSDTLSAYAPQLSVLGNSDVVTVTGGAAVTITGSNDTLSAFGGATVAVSGASSNIQFDSAGGGVLANVSFSLPANARSLTLNSGVDGLIGRSNSVGGNITANGNYDTLMGGAGSDTLSAEGQFDILTGGSGAEHYILGSATDSVQFGIGNASLNSVQTSFSYTLDSHANTLSMQANNATAEALTGNNLISATGSYDQIVAGTGNDTLTANGLHDTMVAGSGNDTFIYNQSYDSSSPIVNASSSSNNTLVLNFSSVAVTMPTNVNTLLLGANANGAAYANSANDSLVAGVNDTVYGGSGLDTLSGGNQTVYGSGSASIDTLVAGTNNDTFIAGTSPDTFVFNTGFKNDLIEGNLAAENIVFGSGILQSNLAFTPLSGGPANSPSLVISGAGGSVTIDGGLVPGAVLPIKFGDGSTASVAQLIAPSGHSTVTGASGNFIFSSYANDSLSGGTGQDTLIAWGSTDTITAGPNGSTVFAGGANTSVQGGAGHDYLVSTGSNNTLTGGAGTSTLVGANASTTYLIAGSGIDTLIGGSSTLNSYYATDYYYINNASDVVNASTTSFNNVYTPVTFTAPVNVQNLYLQTSGIIGTGASGAYVHAYGGDTLIGGAGRETLDGFNVGPTTGSDTLVAGPGADDIEMAGGDEAILNANFSSDTINYGYINGRPSTFLINFGAGIAPANLTATMISDENAGEGLLLSDGSSTVTLNGGLGGLYGPSYQFEFGTGPVLSLAQLLSEISVNTSSINGVATLEGAASTAVSGDDNFDIIYAAGVADTIYGGSATEDLYGLNSNNLLIGGSGQQTLRGYASGDTLQGGSGSETMLGGTGANVTFVINSANEKIQVQTSPGVDTVDSSVSFTLPSGVNTLVLTGISSLLGKGNSGSDTLVSNAAVDTLVGGTGSMYFVLNNASDVVQDTSTSVINSIQSGFSYSLPTNVNVLVLTGTSALVGTANNGADTLNSNSGLDTLIGGNGNDTFVLNNATDVVQDTSTTAVNTVQVGANYTLPTNVNALVLTGTARLAGTANAGNDTLTSNNGVDTLIGLSGNETFVVNNSGDVIVETSTTTTNTVSSSVSFSLIANVNSLTLTGTASLSASANSANDTLTSNAGIDTLIGGAGSETFIINNSSDVVQDTSTTSTNTAKASVSYSLTANVNNLFLTGSGSLIGTANSGNDSLTANSGADTLIGGAGVDTLVAGAAANTLIGGSGNTTFVINNTADVIQDSTAAASNTLRSSVSYSLTANVNSLVLTGTAGLKGTANSGADTLTANSGVDTLVGGAGNDTFVISNANDVVQDSFTTTANTISSTIAFSLPTNVNTLVFTGSTALVGRGNAANDSLVANTGADTLVAGNGTDTLVSSASGSAIDSLVGGTGNDFFVVSYAGDIVNVGATHGNDTIQSSVSYTASANVSNLVLSGTSNLTGTGNTLANVIKGNSGADTLVAGTGVATLIGGTGNDTFVVNSTSDVIQDTTTTASNVISSSVSYTLPTNVNRLILTGTSALVGTANAANDTLTANTGADTLISGSGAAVDSLVGGTGANLFVVNNVADIVTVGGTHGVDTIASSVSFSASANVAILTLTGTAALSGTGSSLAGLITANSGDDTLAAIASADTLVGGTGTDLFVVNNTSQVVSLATSGTADTIQSSVSYTLPTNVQYLSLTGTSALNGTGNSLTDLIVGNTANDTLVAGTGIAALEGGRTSGSDQIKALSNQAALIAGAGTSTLTGGAYKDFYAAGLVSDSITTGATSNVVSVNKGDGATTLQPTTSATNVLSLGAGIDTETLYFTKTGNNLVLTDGVAGDSVTFANWYVGTADQDYTTLQVVEIASANYNSAGSDALRNKPLEEFNLTSLVSAFNTAGSPTNWALSTAMPSAALTSSSTADYGGDLAYYFGLNGNLTGVNLSAVQSTLTNASYGAGTQTIDSFASISGGGGLHLLTQPGHVTVRPVQPGAITVSSSTETPADALQIGDRYLGTNRGPQMRLSEPADSTLTAITPRRGIEPVSRASGTASAQALVSARDISLALSAQIPGFRSAAVSVSTDIPQVPHISAYHLAWSRMHSQMDALEEMKAGGAEVTPSEETLHDALLASVAGPLRRSIGDSDLASPANRRRVS